MRLKPALLALVLLGACHHPHADQPDPGADGDAQAKTAAKTLSDLQAADAASQGPAPHLAPIEHHDDAKPKPAATPAEDAGSSDEAPATNEGNAAQ